MYALGFCHVGIVEETVVTTSKEVVDCFDLNDTAVVYRVQKRFLLVVLAGQDIIDSKLEFLVHKTG